jgi:hypothetical protein
MHTRRYRLLHMQPPGRLPSFLAQATAVAVAPGRPLLRSPVASGAYQRGRRRPPPVIGHRDRTGRTPGTAAGHARPAQMWSAPRRCRRPPPDGRPEAGHRDGVGRVSRAVRGVVVAVVCRCVHDDRQECPASQRWRLTRAIMCDQRDVLHLVAIAVPTRQANDTRAEIDDEPVEAPVASGAHIGKRSRRVVESPLKERSPLDPAVRAPDRTRRDGRDDDTPSGSPWPEQRAFAPRHLLAVRPSGRSPTQTPIRRGRLTPAGKCRGKRRTRVRCHGASRSMRQPAPPRR